MMNKLMYQDCISQLICNHIMITSYKIISQWFRSYISGVCHWILTAALLYVYEVKSKTIISNALINPLVQKTDFKSPKMVAKQD